MDIFNRNKSENFVGERFSVMVNLQYGNRMRLLVILIKTNIQRSTAVARIMFAGAYKLRFMDVAKRQIIVAAA